MQVGRKRPAAILTFALCNFHFAMFLFFLIPLGHAAGTEKDLEGIKKKISKEKQEITKVQKRRARALYKWRRGGSPFVLLNGSSSVTELMQRKRYLELTLAYDHNLVTYLRGESVRQEALQRELAKKREEVEEQRRALVGIKESIRVEREKKKELLSSLRREKDTHVRALKELEQAALRLQKMMDEISRKSVVRPVPAGGGFEAMKGKLEVPVRGGGV